MHQLRDKKINQLLLKEVHEKSLPAAIVFCAYAVITFFYGFGIDAYRPHLQLACVGVFGASLFRYFESKTPIDERNIEKQWMKMRISVWLNAVSWSAIFAFAAWEQTSFGIHYTVVMIIMMTFATGSLITLSFDKWMFYPFQLILMIPTITVWTLRGEESNSYVLAALLTFNLLYHLVFHQEHKRQIMAGVESQVDLEMSYDSFKRNTAQMIQVSKSAALGEMAGGLSHEINNSLQVILISLQHIERDLKKKNLIEQSNERKFQNITNSIEKISSIIDGLKVFSRQMEPSAKEDVSLKTIIERSMNYCFEMVKAHHIQIHVDPIPDVSIHSHPMQITQIIFSLIKNAFDALEHQPTERIIRIRFKQSEDHVAISISNNGPKISDDIKAKLFQPFVTTKDIGEATGLSLSIAQGIAKDHEGTISFDEENDWTTFALNLPAQTDHFRSL